MSGTGWHALSSAAVIFAIATLSVAPAAADDNQVCAHEFGDIAIAACTRAIASGRYKGHNLANQYYNRCVMYADTGDPDRAIADCNQAIRIDPKFSHAYFNRGIANLYSGSLPKALADLNQASELDPKYAYAALWLDIMDKRSNLASRLAEATKQIDMTKWPAPVIRLYLGHLTAEAVLATADDPDANTKKGQVCEANFYTGELDLQQGNKDKATRLFRLAAADCPKTFTEWGAANAELKALGATP